MFARNLVFFGNGYISVFNPRVSYDLYWHYVSNHSGLVIYLNKKWEYKHIAHVTESKLWEKQIIEIFDPNKNQRQRIVIGNIYSDSLNTFMMEFNSTLLEHHINSQKIYMCGDYNVDLLKLNSIPFNEIYFDNILFTGYIPKITLPTRLSENSTLIDNIFTTNLSSDLSAYILDMHISDHQPIILYTNEIYHLQEINLSQLERIPTIKKITSNNVFIVNIYSIN